MSAPSSASKADKIDDRISRRHKEVSLATVLTSSRLTPAQLSAIEATALSFAGYVDAYPIYRAFLVENYEKVTFTAKERAAIEALAGPYTLHAIVEDWCTDVIATLPVFARASDLNPALKLRVLPRSAHPDLAEAYAVPGERSYVPTYVLLDQSNRELGQLIERTPPITDYVRGFAAQAMAEVAERFPGVAKADLPQSFIIENMPKQMGYRNQVCDEERAQLVEWLLATAARGAG